MIAKTTFDVQQLNTILDECRQCGTCCKTYGKVLLQPDEVEFIRKMGGHVGINVGLNTLRGKSMEEAVLEEQKQGKVYMVHPDEHGCIFLQKRNDKYYCRIYHYRPRACRGFRCNLADNSFMDLFGGDAMHLLGRDRFDLCDLAAE